MKRDGAGNEGPVPQNARNLLAEWREDYRLAKLRDETGIEPTSEPIKPEPQPKARRAEKQPSRDNGKGIDIPF